MKIKFILCRSALKVSGDGSWWWLVKCEFIVSSFNKIKFILVGGYSKNKI